MVSTLLPGRIIMKIMYRAALLTILGCIVTIDENTMTFTSELQRQKAYFRTCASSEDSDQTAHSCILIRLLLGQITTKTNALYERTDAQRTAYICTPHKFVWGVGGGGGRRGVYTVFTLSVRLSVRPSVCPSATLVFF